jgi:metal-sulfur cluster biosynthetic enzyme/nitrite reductase/ring-hydroxylating ferredoxin subunit
MHEFERVIDVGEVPDPGKTLVEVEGEMVALFHVDGAWYAIDDVCTHDGGPLADGELRDHRISCPRHGAKFDIRTGAALTMPAVRPTRAHDVKLEDGGVWVRLRDAAAADGPTGAGFAMAPPRDSVPTGSAGNVSESPGASEGSAAVTDALPPATEERTVGSVTVGSGTVAGQALCEDVVREILKEVKDPELFVNIVDLGLIYGVTLTPAAEARDRHHVAIDMTMTSPACPAGPQLIADTKRALAKRSDVEVVEVRIVMDPPWTPDRMTEAARDQLGIF